MEPSNRHSQRMTHTGHSKPIPLETLPSLHYDRSLEHLDHNTKVVLIPLIVSARDNTPRNWAPRDLELTWSTSTLRQPQQPVPGGSQRAQAQSWHSRSKRRISSLASSPQGLLPLVTCAQAWSHCTNPLPTFKFLDDFIWINLNFIAHEEVNRKQIFQTAEPSSSQPIPYSQSVCSTSESGTVLQSFVVPVTGWGQLQVTSQETDLLSQVLDALCDTRA